MRAPRPSVNFEAGARSSRTGSRQRVAGLFAEFDFEVSHQVLGPLPTLRQRAQMGPQSTSLMNGVAPAVAGSPPDRPRAIALEIPQPRLFPVRPAQNRSLPKLPAMVRGATPTELHAQVLVIVLLPGSRQAAMPR